MSLEEWASRVLAWRIEATANVSINVQHFPKRSVHSDGESKSHIGYVFLDIVARCNDRSMVGRKSVGRNSALAGKPAALNITAGIDSLKITLSTPGLECLHEADVLAIRDF